MISTVTVVIIWPNQHFIESGILVTSSSDNDGQMDASNCLDRHVTGFYGSTCVSAAGSSALSDVVRAVVKQQAPKSVIGSLQCNT